MSEHDDRYEYGEGYDDDDDRYEYGEGYDDDDDRYEYGEGYDDDDDRYEYGDDSVPGDGSGSAGSGTADDLVLDSSLGVGGIATGPHGASFIDGLQGFVALSILATGTPPSPGHPVHTVVSSGGDLYAAAAAAVGADAFLTQFDTGMSFDQKLDIITIDNMGLMSGSEGHAMVNGFLSMSLGMGRSPVDVLVDVVQYLLTDEVRDPMFDDAASRVLGWETPPTTSTDDPGDGESGDDVGVLVADVGADDALVIGG